MAILSVTMKASVEDIIKEMDRRGDVIESLERKLALAEEAFIDIDAVTCDFGHYEDAARTMKQIAEKANSIFSPPKRGVIVKGAR